MMKITGSFLADSYTDIPDLNYGAAEWKREFSLMQSSGLDTLIIQRCGIEDYSHGFAWLRYPSRVLPTIYDTVYQTPRDDMQLLLELAEQFDMRCYVGLFRFFRFHDDSTPARLVSSSQRVIDELWDLYGHFRSFAGWYLPHEISRNFQSLEHFQALGNHCKQVSGGLPVMISPGNHGVKNVPAHSAKIRFDESPTPLETHMEEWEEMMPQLTGAVDIAAFQDGHVDFHELADFTAFNKENAEKNGIAFWSNVESFDRDKPIKFLPISEHKLLLKLHIAQSVGVEKAVTFEFPHFLSPYSCYSTAHGLYRRYCEHFRIEPLEP